MEATSKRGGSQAIPFPLQTPEMRSLIRFRQIALDIRRALERQDWELVSHASGLLPDALEACSVIPQEAFQKDPSLSQLAQEIVTLLNGSDSKIEEQMEGVAYDLRRIRMGQRHSQLLKPTAVVTERRRLDTFR